LTQDISIQFTRFSAFYSPLIATIAGGFLGEEGLRPRHSVSAPGTSAIAGLLDGSVHVAQSAPSQGFGPLEQGKTPPALHFAQINEMDGFFLVGRGAEPQFTWDRLKRALNRMYRDDAGVQELVDQFLLDMPHSLDQVYARIPGEKLAAYQQQTLAETLALARELLA